MHRDPSSEVLPGSLKSSGCATAKELFGEADRLLKVFSNETHKTKCGSAKGRYPANQRYVAKNVCTHISYTLSSKL